VSTVLHAPAADRVVLRNVAWDTYSALIRDLKQSSSPRMTFDRGVLEVMSPQHAQETSSRALPFLTDTAVSVIVEASRNVSCIDWLKETRNRIRVLIG
jgi:hypothetical protein